MARGDPVKRAVVALFALESSPRGRRASELAETLGVTTRTVHRILQTLESAGARLTVEHDGPERRWRLARDGHPPLQLTTGEVLALLCAERTAGPGLRATVLGAPLQSALAKVRALVPGDGGDRLLALARAHLSLAGPHHDYQRRDAEIAALRRALEKGVTVSMRYQGRRPGSSRAFDPYVLVHSQGALYAVGWCHRRRAVRTFLVDRIRTVQLTARPFERDPRFDPARHFDGAWGIWRGRPETVRLRFAPAAARWAAERVWPGQKTLTTHLDGSATLTLRLAATPDFVAELLSFGSRVRVLAPKHLAETVAREHFAAAASATRGLRGSSAPVPRQDSRRAARAHPPRGKVPAHGI
ncbi:MAG: helix-turn-helix transcriptional regulator [Myxococcales bacterium]